MKYIIGNWKSNFTIEEAHRWIDVVKPKLPPASDDVTIVLCPSYIHLLLFKLNFPSQILGMQTSSPFPNGTYTGAVSAPMVKGLADFCIVGHSERRTYFKESHQDIVNQITELVSEQITPIIAVDKANWFSQLSLIDRDMLAQSLVMYEPPEAISKAVGPIGVGSAAPIAEVVSSITEIKAEFKCKAVIYGGSVKSSNIVEFLEHPIIDGVLPGSASLDPDEWLNMINLAIATVSTKH
jgi:triosephosphate isomerase